MDDLLFRAARDVSGMPSAPSKFNMTSADITSESLTTSERRTPEAPGPGHSLHSQIRVLVLECSSREDLVGKVLRICAEQFGSSVERFDLRFATSMRTKTAHHEKVPHSVATRFDNELLSPMASETLAGTDPQPRPRP